MGTPYVLKTLHFVSCLKELSQYQPMSPVSLLGPSRVRGSSICCCLWGCPEMMTELQNCWVQRYPSNHPVSCGTRFRSKESASKSGDLDDQSRFSAWLVAEEAISKQIKKNRDFMTLHMFDLKVSCVEQGTLQHDPTGFCDAKWVL